MAYLDYSEYLNWFPETADFAKYEFQAELYLNKFTTGIDNVKKLKVAFPTDEQDATAVKYCVAQLVNTLIEIDQASKGLGFTADANGIHGPLASISSGSESMSFATGSNGSSIVEASRSASAKNGLISDIIRNCLSGIHDKNGVNLLYMGRYPVWLIPREVPDVH